MNPWAAKDWGDEDSDEIPIYYAAQVMHGLMIKPRKRAVVAALTGFDDKPRIHWIARDEETIAGIRAREIEFWERIQSRTPPEPATADDVKWLYQRDAGTIAEADDALVSLCQQLKDIKVDIKTMEAREELIATQIKLAMAEAATLLYAGKPIATWKTQSTRRVDIKALEAAHPDIAEQFRKTTDSRVFRLEIGATNMSASLKSAVTGVPAVKLSDMKPANRWPTCSTRKRARSPRCCPST